MLLLSFSIVSELELETSSDILDCLALTLIILFQNRGYYIGGTADIDIYLFNEGYLL